MVKSTFAQSKLKPLRLVMRQLFIATLSFITLSNCPQLWGQESQKDDDTQAQTTDANTPVGEPTTNNKPTSPTQSAEQAETATESTAANSEETIKKTVAPLGSPTQYLYGATQRQQLIESELDHTDPFAQAIWLDAEGSQFLSLWHKDRSGNPQGAMIIVPDENTSPASKHQLANIQYYLSENGWSTLTLAMPAQQAAKAPPRPDPPKVSKPPAADEIATNLEKSDDKDTSKEAGGDSKPADETQVVYDDSKEDMSAGVPTNADAGDEQLATNTSDTPTGPNNGPGEAIPQENTTSASPTSRIMAALKFLKTQNQFNNVIFAQGTGAAYTIAALFPTATVSADSKEKQDVKSEITELRPQDNQTQEAVTPTDESVTAIIFANAKHELISEQPHNFMVGFKKIDIPVLDIIDNAPGKTALEPSANALLQRQSAAKTSNIPIYKSRKIHQAPLGQKGELRSSRIIRGFLKQHAKGMERSN